MFDSLSKFILSSLFRWRWVFSIEHAYVGEVCSLYRITQKKELSPTIHLMVVEAPDVAAKAKAGQFIILKVDDKGERVPLTIADYDSKAGTITCIFQEVGYTTKQLACLQQGDALSSFVGPLGRPTEIKNYGRVVIIGGGVGIAPAFPIARSLKAASNSIISIIGARSKEILFWEDRLQQYSDRLLVSTDDGSYGHHGFVTDLLQQVLAPEKIDRVWAIGPTVMMRYVAQITKTDNIPTIVSMNPIMVDGTGMCGACRVSVNGETKFACIDGPEFDAHSIDWDLACSRLNTYKEQEQEALARIEEGGRCRCHSN